MTHSAFVRSFGSNNYVKSFGAPAYPYTCREYTPEFFDPNNLPAQTHGEHRITMCAPVGFDFDMSLIVGLRYRVRSWHPLIPEPGPMLRQPVRTGCGERRFRKHVKQWGQQALPRRLELVTKRQEEQLAKAVSLS